jgi:MFS family permease
VATSRLPLAALLAANAISIAGNTLTALAIPWFVLQTTGSVRQTGLVGFFSLLPFVLSAGLGGALVDRLGYRRMSIVADLASGVSVVTIPLLYHTVGLPFAALVALVAAGALLDAPGQTAREAILPQLVEHAGTTIERGASLLDGVSRGARMVGAPLAGVLIAVLDPANVLFVDAATFAVSALLMRVFVAAPARSGGTFGSQGYVADLREGFAYLWRDRLVYADRVLDSVVALGLMGGALSGGAFAGTLLFAWRGHRLPRVKTLVLAFTIGGALRYFVLAVEPGLAPILVWNVLAGIGIGAINPILGTLQYERVPERLRGRVFGAVTAGVLAAAPFGALLAAGCVGLLGLRATLVTFGVVYAACTLSPLVVPAWRDADRASPGV